MSFLISLIMFSLFPLTFFGIFGLVIYTFIDAARKKAQLQLALTTYAQQRGYEFSVIPPPINNLGSFPTGVYSNSLRGIIQPANDQFLCFYQQETTGSGKNRRTYNRTIMNVTVPDTRTHMIINSRINDEIFGLSNLTNYKSSQKYEPEGNFAKYFDVYMPGGLETEGLAILAPNTLSFIMDNLANFDIEIVSNQLYVYAYSFLDVTQIDQLITNVAHLTGMMRLKASDAMPSLIGAAPVARVANDTARPAKLVKGWHALTGVLVGIVVLGRFFGNSNQHYLSIFWAVAGLLALGGLGYSVMRKQSLKNDYMKMKKQEQYSNKPN